MFSIHEGKKTSYIYDFVVLEFDIRIDLFIPIVN